MSTVKAVNFQHPSSSAVNLSLDSAGGVSGGLPSPNRNLLYNGAMQVAQRGTSATGLTSGAAYPTLDRWTVFLNSLGLWTNDVQNDAPTGSGFRRSMRWLCTTNSASPSADGFLIVSQRLEGQDLQRIAKGTTAAQPLTLSFWVKSNVTGTFVAALEDIDNSRYAAATYTISASATWERKTITFPADTAGVLENDNNGSMQVLFWLGAGSNRTSGTLQTAWGSTVTANQAPGQVNLAAATNNYWQVTGVQLEVGPVATPFEFKSYGQELRECQRYYWRFTGPGAYSSFGQGFCISTTGSYFGIDFPVPMRTAPTAIDHSNLAIQDSGSVLVAVSSATIDQSSLKAASLAIITAGSLTAHRPARLICNNNAAGFLGLSAEL